MQSKSNTFPLACMMPKPTLLFSHLLLNGTGSQLSNGPILHQTMSLTCTERAPSACGH